MIFIEHFQDLKDPRSHTNRRHDLLDTVFLSLSAILSGAEGWKEIKEFGDTQLDQLQHHRAFAKGIPVDDTIARVNSALNPQKMMECFVGRVNAMRRRQRHELI